MTPKKDAAPKKEAAPKREASSRKEHAPKKDAHHKSRLHEAFQEEIANTYFRTPSTAKRPSKKKRYAHVGWIFAVIAFCIAAALFISKSNFDIKVKLVNGTPFITKDGSIMTLDGAQVAVRGGEVNANLVARAYFLGDGRSAGTMTDAEVTLANSRGQGWASFVVEFKKPVDLTKHDIRYVAKGQGSAEKLVPIIFDTENRSYRVYDAAVTTLGGDWQTLILNFKPVTGDIDLSSISAIKFEFGTETAGNGVTASRIVCRACSTVSMSVRTLRWNVGVTE
jgi:hypothetical protein